MQKENVKLGEIRLEDSFDEAKIHEPLPLRTFRRERSPSMENHDHFSKSESVCPLSESRTVYRED